MRQSRQISRLECGGNILGEAALLELCNILAKNYAQGQLLDELVLNRAKISTTHLNSALSVMENNCPLQRLGLVSLPLNEISVESVVKVIRKARGLYSLDISGSEVLSVSLVAVVCALSRNRTFEYLNLSYLVLGSQGDMMVSPQKEEMQGALLGILTNNRQLVHLDLSCAQLTDTQFRQLISAVAKAHSLIGVHFTGNGITEECKAKCLAEIKGTVLELGKASDGLQNYPIATLKEATRKLSSPKNFGRPVHDETKYILWRAKGLPGLQGGWVQSDCCFVCDSWQYTVFVFSRELAAKKFVPVNELPTTSNPEHAPGIDRSPEIPSVPEVEMPYLFCAAHNWQPIPFREMTDFCRSLDPDSITRISVRNVCSYVASRLPFRPFFSVPAEEIQLLPLASQVFCVAVLFPPGRHDCYYLLRRDKLAIKMGTVTVPPREDEVRAPPRPPARTKHRVFSKPRSVFRNWHEDTPCVYEKLLAYDFSRSKITRMVKNALDQKGVYAVLKRNIEWLKDEFMSLTAKSAYPFISWIDFTDYCQQKNFVDKTCTLSLIDQLFIAVSVGAKRGAETTERALCRCEFFEILLRIASAKYKEQGTVEFHHEALERLLADLCASSVRVSPQEFRKQQVWTLRIDDLLRGNLPGLNKVFDRYASFPKRVLSVGGALKLRHDCGLELSDLEVVSAYSRSKMTIIQEVELAAAYKQMTFDEFLEFVVRIADATYRREATLEQKLDTLLIRMLGVVGAIKYPPFVPEESSDEEDGSNR